MNRPDSYLETSCTGFFTYGIARSVNRGWIDKSYAKYAEKGWQGVVSRVRPDGKIEGICRGTEVGFTLQFYYDRPTPFNDPRGIGGILFAGTEIYLMNKQSKSAK